MKRIKLTENIFLDQVVLYGFFAEQFPNCFSSESLSVHIKELLPLIPASKSQREKTKKNTTAPTSMSMYKNDISRRVLSVLKQEVSESS